MSESKVQIKIGPIEFSAEGDQDWVSSQLDKILDKIPEYLTIEIPNPSSNTNFDGNGGNHVTPGRKPTPQVQKNLAIFLKEKDATTNQTRKFLATAALLQLNGKNRLNTGDVTEALREANQARLGNPSDCLNKNVQKGHCEKDGASGFFVTSHGLEELKIGM